MSAGREYHVCGAATENARWASSVRTRGTVTSVVTDDRRGRAGAAGSGRSGMLALKSTSPWTSNLPNIWSLFMTCRYFVIFVNNAERFSNMWSFAPSLCHSWATCIGIYASVVFWSGHANVSFESIFGGKEPELVKRIDIENGLLIYLQAYKVIIPVHRANIQVMCVHLLIHLVIIDALLYRTT